MASTYLNIVVDDDTGTPSAPNFDGTPLDSVFFDGIEAILNEFITRSSKTVGGVWTWETFGQHNMTAGDNGTQALLVRNTLIGSANKASVILQANGVGVLAIEMFSTNHTASGAVSAAGGRLVLNGAGTLGIETTASGGIKFYPGGAFRCSVDFTNGPVAENQFGWRCKNTAASVIDGVVVNASNELLIGSDNASGMGDTFLKGGTAIRMRVNAAERAVVDDTTPELLLGGVAAGVLRSLQVGSGASSPTSGQILFGTDGSGWQLRFGKNHGGAVTYLWAIQDTGHFVPITNNLYNMGDPTLRIANVNTTNVNATGAISPNADNAVACVLGDATHRWAAAHIVDGNFGDVSFDNGWSITEGEKVGLGGGLAFVRPDGELCGFLSEHGELYTHTWRPLEQVSSSYRKLTKRERLSGV
jgi:hypothetical protein